MSWHQPRYGYPASRRYDPGATQPLPRQDCYPSVEVGENRSSIPGMEDETGGPNIPGWLAARFVLALTADCGAFALIAWMLR